MQSKSEIRGQIKDEACDLIKRLRLWRPQKNTRGHCIGFFVHNCEWCWALKRTLAPRLFWQGGFTINAFPDAIARPFVYFASEGPCIAAEQR